MNRALWAYTVAMLAFAVGLWISIITVASMF
jgi:hypothetical protein